MKKTKSKRPTTNDQRHVLYLDTSEPEAVIAIYGNSNVSRPRTDAEYLSLEKINEIKWQAGRELSKTLSQKYEELLKKSFVNPKKPFKYLTIQQKLSGICVFVGPGSFTGLRIGISFANGLAYALGIPVYETKKRGVLNLKNPKKIAIPFYGAKPKITKPKKK